MRCDPAIQVLITTVVVLIISVATVLANSDRPPLPKGETSRIGFSHAVRVDDLQNSRVSVKQKFVPCMEPRPQVCTQDYRPVCAELQDGSVKTFTNGCSACSDPTVIGYRERAFE